MAAVRKKKQMLLWVLRLLTGAGILILVLYSLNLSIEGLSRTLSNVIPGYLALSAFFFSLPCCLAFYPGYCSSSLTA